MDHETQIETLEMLLGILWKRLDRNEALVKTLRATLQQGGVIKAEEFEKLLAAEEGTQAQQKMEEFTQNLEEYRQQALHEFFERFEGPKQ
jgi:hypothetical protein